MLIRKVTDQEAQWEEIDFSNGTAGTSRYP